MFDIAVSCGKKCPNTSIFGNNLTYGNLVRILSSCNIPVHQLREYCRRILH